MPPSCRLLTRQSETRTEVLSPQRCSHCKCATHPQSADPLRTYPGRRGIPSHHHLQTQRNSSLRATFRPASISHQCEQCLQQQELGDVDQSLLNMRQRTVELSGQPQRPTEGRARGLVRWSDMLGAVVCLLMRVIVFCFIKTNVVPVLHGHMQHEAG